jgi:hypothetical protein
MQAADESKVFVAEHGLGGRPARVIRSYTAEGRERIVVDFEDTTEVAHRDCFATSVHATKAEADTASL